jgi:MFS family permease
MTLSVATSVAADQANQASARLTMGGGLAVMTAPLILGWTADQIGLQGAFAIVIVLFAMAGAVAVTANFIAQAAEKERALQEHEAVKGSLEELGAAEEGAQLTEPTETRG